MTHTGNRDWFMVCCHFTIDLFVLMPTTILTFENYLEPYFISVSVLGLVIIISVIFLPESPRQCIVTGKHEKGRAVFVRFARWTKNEELVEKYKQVKFKIPKTADGQDKRPYIELLKWLFSDRKRAVEFLVVCLIWFVNIFTAYSGRFFSSHIPGKLYYYEYIGIVYSVAIYLTIYPFFKKARRKLLSAVGYPMQIVGGILFYVINNQTFRYFEPIITKIGYKMTFLVVYAQTAELYPTEVRGLAFGIANSVGRIAAIVSVTFNTVTFFQATYIGNTVVFIGWILSFFVRETKGMRMTDRIDEELQREETGPVGVKATLRTAKSKGSVKIENPFEQ